MWKNQIYFSLAQGSWMLRTVNGSETKLPIEEARRLYKSDLVEDKTPPQIEKCIPPALQLFN